MTKRFNVWLPERVTTAVEAITEQRAISPADLIREALLRHPDVAALLAAANGNGARPCD
jgi:outer membrane protein TolC